MREKIVNEFWWLAYDQVKMKLSFYVLLLNMNLVDNIYKGGETRVRGVGSDLSFSGLMKLAEEVVRLMQPLPEIVMGPLPSLNDIVTTMSDDDASDQMHDDYAEDDTINYNDDNYVGGHDDCLEEDKGDDNDISDCNHTDDGT
ncbi:Uncharacterized protein TCM_011257 [Theobroma cacao]|uniref:Uncharacterized protein n=1 Tax=Theobroma cacao TaxID=3641 RepID=A0A061EGA3_THECC|nr:Uncharacterized protein TCM_011257 [Theobroma cacao]